MKRLHLIIIIALLSGLTAVAKKQKQLVILHSNDTHSCIMPLNPNLDNKDLAGRGGFLRRAAMIKEERQQNPELLLIDSGDFSQGSGYYTLFKGEVEIGLMNQMGYDCATIGNHEFDFGMDNMARLFRMANFPIICSNYDCTGTVLEDLVKPYIVLKRNGIKIGLFALAPPMKGLVFDGNCEGITFIDPVRQAENLLTLGDTVTLKNIFFHTASAELYESSLAELDRFVVLIGLLGEGQLTLDGDTVTLHAGESILIPATCREVSVEGTIKFLETYV